MKYKYQILLGIFIISLIGSMLISFTPTPAICNPNEGCDTVLTSKYAYTFNIKNSYYGTLIFGFLSILTFSHIKKPHHHKKHAIHLSTIIGGIIALYLIYLQYAILKSWCKYCLIIDSSLILGGLIVLFTWKK